MKNNIFTLFLLLMFWLPLSHANLTIEINNSSENALPIAIIPFSYTGTNAPKVDIAQVISANLYRSGKFKAIPVAMLPSMPNSFSEVNYLEWRILEVDSMLLGHISMTDRGLYNVDIQFIDLLRKKEVIRKRWNSISNKQLRQVAHKMSDEIYQELTGIRGAFSTKIAYVTVKKKHGKKTYTLQVADADGFNSKTILKSKQPIMSPSWSPDGKKLAYVSFENGRSEIFTQHLKRKNRKKIASYKGINGSPAWSKDGENIAMTLSKNGSADIFVKNLKTSLLTRLTKNYAIETEAVWAPDGKSLFFNSDRRGKPQIFQVFLNSKKIKRVSYNVGYNANPAVSSDGRYLAMVNSDNGFNIGLQDLYTKEFNVITNTYLDESPTFSPNGEMILYSMTHQGKSRLAVVAVDNSMTQILTTSDGEVSSPSWGPFTE